MTSRSALVPLVLLALGASACAAAPQWPGSRQTPVPGTPPASSAPHAAQGMPQPANSLPPGARVNAPLAAPTGVVETTRVW